MPEGARVRTNATLADHGLGLLILGSVLCLLPFVSPGIALVGGVFLALALPEAMAKARGTKYASQLLKLSVIGLGAGMNLSVVWSVGAQTASYTAIGILLTLSVGIWVGRKARLPADIALLISVGTAICGGSAIAAIAGVIKPKQQDVTVALTSVFLLNAVALFVFPSVGLALGYTPRQFGLWAALAIHDTSSVVGAAIAYGHDAVSIATTAKLTRALWIVPVALLVGFWRRGKEGKQASASQLALPYFILGFLAMAALFTYCGPLSSWRLPVTLAAQRTFAVTLFLIGSGFSRSALRTVGLRPLVFAVILWLVVGIGTACAITGGWIH